MYNRRESARQAKVGRYGSRENPPMGRNKSQSFLFFHKQRSGAEVFRSNPFELVFFHSSDP